MTANELLDESLKDLAAKLYEIPNEHLPEIRKIREAIASFENPGLEVSFSRKMKELAEAVIHVREHTSIALLKRLPVPPYDLWLPFKAENLRKSDSDNVPGDVGFRNVIISQISMRLEPLDPKIFGPDFKKWQAERANRGEHTQ